MFVDRVLLEGVAAPVTLVSWRSHRVEHVVVSASAAEVRAFWSAEQENVPPLISVTDSKGNYDHLRDETVDPSEDRSAIDLAIIRRPIQTTDVLTVG